MAAPPGYDSLYQSAAWFLLPGGQFVRLHGEDVKGWLQGQVTQDLRDLGPGSSADACLLKATGQIEAVLKIWLLADGAIVWASDPRPLLERAARFVILEDVRAEEPGWDAATLQGPEATARVSAVAGATAADALEADGVWFLRHRRTGPGGWDVVGPAAALGSVREALGSPEAGADETLALAQLEAGIPVPGVDIGSKTLPPELGHAFESKFVSYKKGCYSGQEVVMRIHSRGHTNRTWVRLRAESPLEACAPLVAPDGSEAGHVTQFRVSPRIGVVGAGWVRNAWAGEGTVLRSNGAAVEVAPPCG